jgi:hypothetical protein
MRQQDAEEFFTHLLISLWRYAHAHLRSSNAGGGNDDAKPDSEPTETFAFAL